MDIYRALVYDDDIDTEDAIRWKRYKIMEKMGWTYHEYQNTPAHIVTEIYSLMNTETKAQNTKLKEAD